jgi:hypothetical protein
MRVDGLHVGPFTHHPDGDRSLRDAGLTAEGWVQWVTRIIAHDQQVRTSDITALRPGRKEEFERASDAVGAWEGPAAVRQKLSSLWLDYEREAKAWRARNIEEVRKHHGLGIDPETHREMWSTMMHYQPRLPTLRIFLVAYPSVVVQPVPPVSAIVGMGDNWYRDGERHAATLLTAARVLADGTQ